MPPEGFRYRLGKRPKRVDARTLQFRRYLTTALPPPPDSVDWQSRVPASAWNIDGNDQYGDCTVAAAAHMIETWTYNADPGAPVNIPPATVVSDYFALTGGPDDGLDLLTVLNAWRGNGLPTGGPQPDRISAYAELTPGNQMEIEQAVALFGGAYIGVVLPDYVLQQALGAPWALPASGPAPPADPNNGHCVPLLGYDGTYFYCLTWGAVTPVTPAFLAAYMDEGYAVLSPDWIETAGGEAPSGFDLAQLQADLAAIGGSPPPPPAPAPSPNPCVAQIEKGVGEFLRGQLEQGASDIEAGIGCLIESLGLNGARIAQVSVEAAARRTGKRVDSLLEEIGRLL